MSFVMYTVEFSLLGVFGGDNSFSNRGYVDDVMLLLVTILSGKKTKVSSRPGWIATSISAKTLEKDKIVISSRKK